MFFLYKYNEGKFQLMNTNSKKTRIYIALMLIGAAVSSALRSAAYILHFDYEIGFFTDKSLINAADIIIWLTAIVSLSYLFIADKISVRPSFSSPLTYIPTGLLGVASFFMGIRIFKYALSSTRFPLLSGESIKNPLTMFAVLVSLLSLCSVVYCFFNTYVTDGHSALRAYFALGTIVFLAFYAILSFLDLKSNPVVSLADAGKAVNLMAFLLSAIFLLYEARISIGREMWKAYTAFGLAAAVFCAYSSIPAIITYYASGHIISASGKGSLSSIEEAMLVLTLFIYIASRLVLSSSLREKKENDLVNAIRDEASQKEAHTEESFSRHQEKFAAKQLSIFELFDSEEPASDEISEDVSDEPAESAENEEKAEPVMISDDAIYESIFGKMPEKKDIPESMEEQNDSMAESEEPADERPQEEITEDLLQAMDDIIKEETKTKSNESDNDE